MRTTSLLLTVVLLFSTGCIGTFDQSWKPSFKRDVIGRELVAMRDAPTDPTGRSTPAWRARDRLRVVKAVLENQFLQVDPYVTAVVVGDPKKRTWVVASWYESEGGIGLTPRHPQLLLIPKTPPAWLETDAKLPSAHGATMAELKQGLESDDGVPTFAALELTRRATKKGTADPEAALRLLTDIVRDRPGTGQMSAVIHAVELLDESELAELRPHLVEAMNSHDVWNARGDAFWQDRSLRHALGVPEPTTQPASGNKKGFRSLSQKDS